MSVQFGSEKKPMHIYDERHQHAILMQKSTGPPNCCFQQRSDGVHESTFASQHRRKRVDRSGERRGERRGDRSGERRGGRAGVFFSKDEAAVFKVEFVLKKQLGRAIIPRAPLFRNDPQSP